jgi:general secretion pathway protein D
MGRIEQLVNMLDRPGRLRECRFRPLQYTAAPALADKVRTLAQQLKGVPVTMASARGKEPADSWSEQPVYLDTDERTNRIVMIGHEEHLGLLEELIDVLDVGRQDLRTQMTYNLKHIEAQEALSKLQQLEVLGPASASAGKPRMGASGKASSAKAGVAQDDPLTAEPIVVVLEATNQLLVKATQQQHVRIAESIDQIDVSAEDLRTLEAYEIQHVDAEQVRTKLEELDIIGGSSAASARITTRVQKAGSTRSPATSTAGTADVLLERPQVVVTESTNSLLVNATAEQHARIATIIGYVDSRTPEEEIPYRIYPLENSSPQHVAELLGKLIEQTAEDRQGKIEKVAEAPTKTEDQITIVPDPNTFSLIVYANRENQEWIENLTKSLDKRRPQVLIDVTLVEITRTDTFEYDLNLVANAKDAVIGNIGISPIHTVDSSSRLEGSFNLVDQDGNPTGQTQAFYSDRKVQALLTAIKRKNYGRVLAKPKILVDDGQEGHISTTDETTYVKESIQVPDQGAPITTRDFEAIEASIELQITPHIGEGNLLRLDVHLSREDFGTRPQAGAPPDKATSQVTTTVFVPDKHTVILGGLVKLNQSKGGSKVPILGDIPLVGALFRSVDNSDIEKKLYVFLKANMVRPNEEAGLEDLQKVSDQQREAFEESEAEFQKHRDIPGIKSRPMQPVRVLEEK